MRRSLRTLQAREAALASPAEQLALLHTVALDEEFEGALSRHHLPPLAATRLDTLQINVGKLCNQTCRHCHVDAGPDRREVMTRETMELCLAALARTSIPTVDITGGAPELNPHFRWLVEACRELGRHVMDRCNLTILETGAHYDLPQFLAEQRVELVCSLPHVDPERTDRQRGEGVFAASIAALKRLNALGYGDGASGLRLVLVANPVGAYLPGDQGTMEDQVRQQLAREHGVVFDDLVCITNMPISRYLEWLHGSGNLEGYVEQLGRAFNPRAAEGVMCRTMLSVGWDGHLYDCDFNQMLDLRLLSPAPQHIRDFDLAALERRAIAVERHCFGCTAGQGSSCGGATA